MLVSNGLQDTLSLWPPHTHTIRHPTVVRSTTPTTPLSKWCVAHADLKMEEQRPCRSRRCHGTILVTWGRNTSKTQTCGSVCNTGSLWKHIPNLWCWYVMVCKTVPRGKLQYLRWLAWRCEEVKSEDLCRKQVATSKSNSHVTCCRGCTVCVGHFSNVVTTTRFHSGKRKNQNAYFARCPTTHSEYMQTTHSEM